MQMRGVYKEESKEEEKSDYLGNFMQMRCLESVTCFYVKITYVGYIRFYLFDLLSTFINLSKTIRH